MSKNWAEIMAYDFYPSWSFRFGRNCGKEK
jgi:hypothetical protein